MWCSMGRYTGRTFVLTLQFSNYKSKHVFDIWVNYVMFAVSKYVFLRVGQETVKELVLDGNIQPPARQLVAGFFSKRTSKKRGNLSH